MYKNKIELNSLNFGMSTERLKELLEDPIPSEKLISEALKALQPDDKLSETLRKLLKEDPHIFENPRSNTANALARDCKFQSKIYNLLNL